MTKMKDILTLQSFKLWDFFLLLNRNLTNALVYIFPFSSYQQRCFAKRLPEKIGCFDKGGIARFYWASCDFESTTDISCNSITQ
jgi:hypothetical protein